MDDTDDCTTRDIDFGDGKALKIKEFTLLQDDAGAVVWDAGLVLSYYLSHKQAQGRCLVGGRTCLELGSGTGVVGLTAARLGAAHVYLTDLPHLVPYLLENIQLNGLGARCSAAPLDWGDRTHFEAGWASALLRRPPDVVLASDVVYMPATRTAFFAALSAVLGPLQPPAGATVESGMDAGGQEGCREGADGQRSGAGAGAEANRALTHNSPIEGRGADGSNTTCSIEPTASGAGEGRGAPGPCPALLRCGQSTAADSLAGDRGCPKEDGHTGPFALLCYEQRPGVEELPALIAKHGLVAEEVPLRELHPDWRCAEITLLVLRRRYGGG